MLTILYVIIALAFIVIAIVRFNIHPFLALFVGAIGYGLMSGMPTDLIIESVQQGFGGVLGSVGILILLGVIIGTFMEKTGGAFVIATKVLSYIGEKSVKLAMMISGYILSIPVFGDSTFIMLNPISKSLSFKGKVPFAATTIALTLGASASHSLVPPTPGPIAAAGIYEADLGQVIFWGLLVSIIAMVPAYFFIEYATKNIDLKPTFAADEEKLDEKKVPSAAKSFLPILLPLLLIVLSSIANYPTQPFGNNAFTDVITFIGHPIVALLIGVFLTFSLPEKFDLKLLSSTGWIGEALVIAGPIILITGSGGVFGKMLQNSGIADLVSANLENAQWGIFLPFLMALILKTAQGSSTVALITTASVMAPLLASLGMDSETMRVFAVLATGAGAIAISHANDSFFWVMTQMTGMTVKQGNQTHSIGTLILAGTSIILLYVISMFLG